LRDVTKSHARLIPHFAFMIDEASHNKYVITGSNGHLFSQISLYEVTRFYCHNLMGIGPYDDRAYGEVIAIRVIEPFCAIKRDDIVSASESIDAHCHVAIVNNMPVSYGANDVCSRIPL
jgi:hypothetical protein